VIMLLMMTIKSIFLGFHGRTNKRGRKMRIPMKVSNLSTEWAFLKFLC